MDVVTVVTMEALNAGYPIEWLVIMEPARPTHKGPLCLLDTLKSGREMEIVKGERVVVPLIAKQRQT